MKKIFAAALFAFLTACSQVDTAGQQMVSLASLNKTLGLPAETAAAAA